MTIEPLTEDSPAVEVLIKAVDDLCGVTIAESAAITMLNAAVPLICADLIAAHDRRVAELEAERGKEANSYLRLYCAVAHQGMEIADLENALKESRARVAECIAAIDLALDAIPPNREAAYEYLCDRIIRVRNLLTRDPASCPACAPSAEPTAEGGEQ